MDPIEFLATLPGTGKPIKIAGDPAEGGTITLDVPGTEFAKMLTLAAFGRGRLLKVSIEAANQGVPT